MYRLIITWLTAASIALFAGTTVLAAQGVQAGGVRMVTATGRAVINDQAAIHEAKNTRLRMHYILPPFAAVPRLTAFHRFRLIPAWMIILLCARQPRSLTTVL